MSENARPSLAPLAPASPEPTSPGIELARLAGRGDVRATKSLLRSVAPTVVRVVRMVLGPAHPDVDDAVQHSLIGFIQSLPSFRGECEPGRFAARIAVRTATAARRRSRLIESRRDDLDAADSVSVPPADTSRKAEVVRALLAEIPEEQAEALAMRVVLGWSIEEIAASAGVPINTVRSRLRLAKQAMRRRIEADPRLVEELEVDG